MLYGLIFCFLSVFVFGILTGVSIVRYGIGLGSKLYVRSKHGITIDEDMQNIEQEFTK